MLKAFQDYIVSKTRISETEFHTIAAHVQSRVIRKETILLKQDEICHYVFFVAKGLLRSYSVDQTGREHVIQFAPEDSWITERNSFYFNEPSMFFIDAIEDAEVVYLDKEFFSRAESTIPAFNAFNVMALHNSIRFMQRRINLLLGATAEQRYLDFIELYPNLMQRVPQWMIASYLGITPESLSRVRKEMTLKSHKS